MPIRFAPCLALAALLSPAVCHAAPVTAAQVDAVFKDYDRKDSPGCALAVIQDGKIVYSKGYGMASLEHGVAISPQTVFDIGSTSKQFTAASILLLARDGRLALDDDIRKHVPEMPDYGTPVTIRHLLHHTSGIREYVTLLAFSGINFQDVATDEESLVAIARQKSLDFPPGSEHGYSNSGYFLLSVIIERASGKTYRDFAQERIFTPLGMASTQILNDHTLVIPRRATSYGPRQEGGFAVEMSNWEQTGDGGVQTTVEDLAKWDRNFYDPKVGGPWLIEQLQEVGTLNDGEKLTYARGLQVMEYRGLRRVSHAGGWAGYRAEMIRFPEQKLSTITLCNLGSTNPSGLAQQVADLYLGDRLKPVPAAPDTAPATAANPVAAPDAARSAGLYWSAASGLLRTIAHKEGRLHYERGPGNVSELASLGGDRFAMVGAPIPTEVSFPAPGRMEVVSLGEKPLVFAKVEPVSLKPEDLPAYTGIFISEELDITWTLTVEGDHLAARWKRSPSVPLRPVFAEAFQAPFGLLRFTREGGTGKVTGFALDAGRTRNLKFEKE